MENKTVTTHHETAEHYFEKAQENLKEAICSIHKPTTEEEVKDIISHALCIAIDCGDFDLASEVIYEACEFAIGHYEMKEERE